MNQQILDSKPDGVDSKRWEAIKAKRRLKERNRELAKEYGYLRMPRKSARIGFSGGWSSNALSRPFTHDKTNSR